MAILFWLLPALMVTCAASAWVAWVSRGRPHWSSQGEQSEEAQARAQRRMADALAKPHIGRSGAAQHLPGSRERSTGVAVRRD